MVRHYQHNRDCDIPGFHNCFSSCLVRDGVPMTRRLFTSVATVFLSTTSCARIKPHTTHGTFLIYDQAPYNKTTPNWQNCDGEYCHDPEGRRYERRVI